MTRGAADWTAHLREGGTTTWRSWRTAHPDATATGGAAQLEVLRRLERDGARDVHGLADLMLSTAALGRGIVDPPIVGPQPTTAGAPAVEPDELPTRELLRVAAVAAARLAPASATGAVRPAGQPLPWWRRRGVVLHGSPLTAGRLAERVRAAGHDHGGRSALRIVVVRPFAAGMAETWASRIARGGTLRWPRLWTRVAVTGELPPPVDVLARATRLGREHPGRVHVLVAEDADVVAGLLGDLVPLPPGASAPAPDLDPDLWEARRWLNRADAAMADRLPRFTPFAATGSGRTLGPPPAYAAWARAQAERLADGLAGAHPDYAVHGDPASVVRLPARSAQPDPEAVLDRLLGLVVTWWNRSGGAG